VEDGRHVHPEETRCHVEIDFKRGPDAFYKGPIADQLVVASSANGGVLSKKDFEDYSVEELPPVHL